MRYWRILLLVLLPGLAVPVLGEAPAVTSPPSVAASAKGGLVIVGGALRPDNEVVHRAFIERLPAAGPVVIVPVASGQPATSAARFAATLQGYGVAPERLVTFPLALLDDPATEVLDEGSWADNAWDTAQVAAVADAAGFWFTGGDQVRIVNGLRKADGSASPLLNLVNARLAAGAVVGGTSAGAAIMSQHMIAGGDSFTALTQPMAEHYAATEEQDSGRLSLLPGLGFFTAGIVDQHFDRKARLGRLVRALAATGAEAGFGVDEDTALVVDLAQGRGRVVGSGSVVLLDARKAEFAPETGRLASGLRLAVAHDGVEIDLASQQLLSGLGKPTVANPYYNHQPRHGGGMAFANARLDQLLGHDLLDNRRSKELRRLSLDGEGALVTYRFYQTARSQGYWDDSNGDRYSASDVGFDVLTGR
ncbi:MAG: cyanophycinase [Haliea sp.]|uniref:cyanophycinase n=1 Tax=Haliea sp. TaxID=1932666 RepID=UPI0032F0849B